MKGKNQMRKSLGFTLAEVLITLAIIGVVAAMTIPSVIINTNQQEFKTGLKKAVSVLNQAITMNLALENMGPGDTNTDAANVNDHHTLMGYLAQRLNVIKSTDNLIFSANDAFYTSDGMRFEFPSTAAKITGAPAFKRSGCGSGKTEQEAPCLIVVDVNGDRKPNPIDRTKNQGYSIPDASNTNTRIFDVFPVMITDTAAVPYGVVAQRTMFQGD